MDNGILLLLFLLLLVRIFSNLIKYNRKYKQKSKSMGNSLSPLDLTNSLPYKQTFILTKNEYRFYRSLKLFADKNNLLICPKVGLKDLFTVTDEVNDLSWFNRIAQKHIDFLLCDNMLKPLFAIELDDKSHDSGQNKNDELKNALFKQSDISLIRIRARAEYTEKSVEDAIREPVLLEYPNKISPTEDWVYQSKKKQRPEEDLVNEGTKGKKNFDETGKKESIWKKKLF